MSRTRTAKTRRNRKRNHKRRFKKRLARGSTLKVRTLAGLPDKIMVKLPYTFAYNALFPPDGSVGGDILMAFAGNSYPNIAGLDPTTSGVSVIETPTNFFTYGSRYGKVLITGAKLDVTAAYGGTFGEYDDGTGAHNNPPINGVLFEPPTLALIASAYDCSGPGNGIENTGGFTFDGVSAQVQRPSAGASYLGNWSTIAAANIEEMMSMPNTQIRQLSSPFGNKTICRFTNYQSVKKFTGIKDLADSEDLWFTAPEAATEPVASLGDDVIPTRGFGWMLKGFVRNGAANANGAGTNWQISGRITYYVTFAGLRPIDQEDWIPS